MSFFDDASLAFLPSSGAGKDGKAYSIKPTTGAGDFTFSRGSNLAATRVGPTGLIEKGRENLFTYSNDFSNAAWLKNRAIVTSGQSGYDGSSDAWKLIADIGGSSSRVYQLFSSTGVITTSIYAKAAEYNYVGLYFAGSNVGVVWSLIDGTPQNPILSYPNIYGNGESIGNGWWRFSITHNAISGDVRVFPCEQNIHNGNTPDGVSGIYIQDAQIEIGLAATDYIESGATTGKAGLLEDEPRFDYSGGATCPSLLLEPSRTNYIRHSEYINESVASWSRFFSTIITNNDAISPDGKNNATKIECPIGQNARIDAIVVGLAAGTYTYSFYAKGNVSNLDVNIYEDATGDTLSSTAIETLINDSEWSRVDITFTSTTSSTIRCIYTALTAGDYFYLWGAQLEAGSYPTSYIPNHSGGSVTREADDCDGAGDSSTFNDSEGVLYLESSWLSNELGTSTIAISDGTTSNRIILGYIGADDDLYATSIGGASAPSLMRYNVGDITTNHKIAIKYKANDFALWIDGVERGTQSSGTTPVGLNELSFSSGTGGSKIYGNMKQILYFPTTLTNEELAALTTI